MLSPRARRAVPLIAAALTVIIVGGVLYLRSGAPSHAIYAGPARLSQLEGRFWPDFYFVTPSLGWAAIVQTDANKIWVYRTTDGSSHWQRQFVTTERIPVAPTIRFFDARNGYLFAGRLYRTSDGGAHWETISLPDGTEDFDIAGATRAWAVDNAVAPASLYATTDGGLTWRLVGKTPAPMYGKGFGGYEFRPSGEGWAGGQAGAPTVYATFDGGATWRSIALPTSPKPVPEPSGKGGPYMATYATAVVLVPGNGVVADELDYFGRESLFITFDRGETWNSVAAPPPPARFGDISFVDSEHWWASRYDTVFKTSDAGRTWHSVATVTDVSGDWTLDAAHVIDTRHAWIVMTSQFSPAVRNQSRALLTTSDGGLHWVSVNVPQPG